MSDDSGYAAFLAVLGPEEGPERGAGPPPRRPPEAGATPEPDADGNGRDRPQDCSSPKTQEFDSIRQLWSSSEPKKYISIDRDGVVAIRLDLDLTTEGVEFKKWGGSQTCKRNDWLVCNLLYNDIYSVDDEKFRLTHEEKPDNRGRYIKTAPVFAVKAETAGILKTLEGGTEYKQGDYIVSDREEGGDFYAVHPCKFDKKYLDCDVQKERARIEEEKERKRARIEEEKEKEDARKEKKLIDKLREDAKEEERNAQYSLNLNIIRYNGLQLISIIAGALVPVLALSKKESFATMGAAIVGAIAAVSSTIQSLQRFSIKCARDEYARNGFRDLADDAESITCGSLCARDIRSRLKEIRRTRDCFLGSQRGGDQDMADYV